MLNPSTPTRPCPTCKGAKTVSVTVKGDDGRDRTESRPCPTCRGSGVSDGIRTK